MRAKLTRSDKAGKRYKVVLDGKKTIHFGQKNGETFIDHGNTAKKRDWIARHKVNENWGDPKTAGFWAKHILWNRNQKTIRVYLIHDNILCCRINDDDRRLHECLTCIYAS